MTPIRMPFIGFTYFLTRPYLWLKPLVAALFTWFILCLAFFLVTFYAWPPATEAALPYTWGIFKAIGIASIVLLLLWALIFPLFLVLSFESMLKRILHDQGKQPHNEPFFRGLKNAARFLIKTLGRRLFWPLLTLVITFTFPPIAFFISQIGFGAIALLDGCELSLILRGHPPQQRWAMLKAKRFEILLAAVSAGILSTVLSLTLIAWIFLLPGLYVGALLWTESWSSDFNATT